MKKKNNNNMSNNVLVLDISKNWEIILKEKDIKIKARVPGSIFEELIEEKIIDDPFYGLNEHQVKWVYESDWIYLTKFNVSDEILSRNNILLKFYGIDTFSKIELNGKVLGSTNNMFRMFKFDVKELLKKKENILKISIQSAIKKAKKETERYGIKLHNNMGLPGIPYLRKAQYSFGWDWGPKLPDIGIWKKIKLISFNDIKIKSIYVEQNLNYEKDLITKNYGKPNKVKSVDLDISIDFDFKPHFNNNFKLSDGYSVEYSLFSPQGNVIIKEKEKLTKENLNNLENSNIVFKLKMDNPLLWWTHDLGKSNLYMLKVFLIKDSEEIDSKTMNIGIRDIKLIRNEDKWGESFFFLLNGVPIFAKGANWIPIDSFIPRGKRIGLYEINLKAAKESNMNMIRVWGGGIYEDNLFYDLCDELGILVWQDFPFACSVTPPESIFIENVKIEAIENIKRIRNHPSIALWCGNNEVEWMYIIYSRFVLNPKRRTKFKDGYSFMFEKMLPELVKKYNPQIDYWPSSPSNGIGNKGGPIKGSNLPNRGDSHYWMVWHGGKSFLAYRNFNSRFMSEYGFESFPSMKTLASICPPEQYDFYSPIMENHQKNRAGNKKIMNYMKKRYSIPKNFENQVVLSQITHGEAMEYGVEHWRRNRNEFHCMGSLYWQLNDCWQVASWASIDYFGRWKALQYFAKRIYEPFFPSVLESKEKVELWITNDKIQEKFGVLSWKICKNDGIILLSGSENVKIDGCSSLLVKTVKVIEFNKEKKNMRNNIIFYELKDVETEKIYYGFRLFDQPRHFKLPNPILEWNIEPATQQNGSEWDYTISITTNEIALYTFIDSTTNDFITSDNYFPMYKGQNRDIFIKMTNKDRTNISIDELKKKIVVNSLFGLLK